MKRCIALLLIAATLLVCGCSGQPDTPETTPPATSAPEQTVAPTTAPQPSAGVVDMQIVELTAWVISGDLWLEQSTLDEMLAEFNAYYPNILVNVEQADPARLTEETPNIILGSSDDLAALAAEGRMADMSTIWENLKGDIYDAAEEVCGDENGYFTIPLCMVPYCMAINTEKFEAAQAMSLLNSASHTWSTGNFLQACVNLYHSGIENALTIYCLDTDGDVYSRLLAENMYGGAYVNTINGTYTADSSALANGVKELRECYGVLYKREISASMALEQFINEETALTMNWSSALQLEHGDNENIFFMLYPSTGRSKTYADVYGMGVMTTEDPTEMAASMTFAAFISTSDAAVRATGQLPARMSAADAYAGTEQEEVMKELSKLLNYVTKGEVPGLCWEGARQCWVDMLQEISRGTNVIYCTQVCQVELEALLREAGY